MATKPEQVFSEKVPGLMRCLMSDFALTDIQSAGVWGNAGHESLGFTQLQEVGPRAGRGGLGFFQWTGPRRRAFEEYCQRTHQDPKSDGANYGYLWRELSGHQPGFDYSKAITDLKKTNTLSEAVRAFERAYEKAGVKNYASRDRWAERALAAYRRASDDSTDEVKRIQERLTALGHPVVVDGIIGPKTLAAIAAALGV